MSEPLSDQEILRELGSESLLNRVRREVYSAAARIEQRVENATPSRPYTVFQMRRDEFAAAQKVIDIVLESVKETKP